MTEETPQTDPDEVRCTECRQRPRLVVRDMTVVATCACDVEREIVLFREAAPARWSA